MAELCTARDDPRGLLKAIEAAKGRTLADLLRKREGSGGAVDGTSFDEAALHVTPEAAADLVRASALGTRATLPPRTRYWPSLLAQRHSARAGSRWIWQHGARSAFALTVDLGGTEPRRVRPRAAWRRSTDWLFNLLQALPPDGHLVLSPDAELHQWPLHMATTPSGPLGLVVGVSRIHGIDALRRLAASLPTRPQRSIAIQIPARDEAEPGESPRHGSHRRSASTGSNHPARAG